MTERRRQQCRAAQARYSQTPKGRATTARFRASATCRAMDARNNAKLIRAGRTYIGKAATVEQATVLKAYIRSRLHEFVTRQQTGTQAESVSPGAVSLEASPPADRLGGRGLTA